MVDENKIDELLDEFAVLAIYWKDWRDEGKVPRGIRAGMLDVCAEIVGQLGKNEVQK